MFARPATRAASAISAISKRGFHTTRPQFKSQYHYPEGPRSNLPFDPLSKYFFFKYWGFMAVGFGTPFAIVLWQTKKNAWID